MNKTPFYAIVIIWAVLSVLSISGVNPEPRNKNCYGRYEIHKFLQRQSTSLLDSAFAAFYEGAEIDTTSELPGMRIMKDTNNIYYGRAMGFFKSSEHLRNLADSVLYGKINLDIK